MKVTILGCGSSAGVPNLYRQYGDCDPNNPKNNRCRTSLLLEKDGFNLLFDTPPEIRLELQKAGFPDIHSLVFTHMHADHTAGINDLKTFGYIRPLTAYLSEADLEEFYRRFNYLITGEKELDMFTKGFDLHPIKVNETVEIGPFSVHFLDQQHGAGHSLGFRIGNFAYSTDVNEMPEETFSALAGIDTWVLGCVSVKENGKHLHLAKALKWIERIKPRRVYLTHMGTTMDYETLCKILPDFVRPAHDGLSFEV